METVYVIEAIKTDKTKIIVGVTDSKAIAGEIISNYSYTDLEKIDVKVCDPEARKVDAKHLWWVSRSDQMSFPHSTSYFYIYEIELNKVGSYSIPLR